MQQQSTVNSNWNERSATLRRVKPNRNRKELKKKKIQPYDQKFSITEQASSSSSAKPYVRLPPLFPGKWEGLYETLEREKEGLGCLFLLVERETEGKSEK